jgi:RNA polymerase sigma-70 factor (ECF subfamily)
MTGHMDREWVKQLKNGSSAAFAELYAKYKERLIFFCNRFLKGEVAPEDIIQDIFIQVWENRHDLNPDLSFSGYIHTLARNRILNIFRQMDVHTKFAQHISNRQQDVSHQTEDDIAATDYTQLLNQALESLTPKQREVFTLSRTIGLSYKEISEKLKISVPTVQEHASIALKKIKEYLTIYGDIHFKMITIIFCIFS